jgi:serine/threonine protein kinase
LEIGSAIGEGAFGQVMKGTLRMTPSDLTTTTTTTTLLPVAVKMLKASAQDKELVDLISEMQTFKMIGEHENILRLIGCCTNTGKSSTGPYVIIELCNQGNLR